MCSVEYSGTPDLGKGIIDRPKGNAIGKVKNAITTQSRRPLQCGDPEKYCKRLGSCAHEEKTGEREEINEIRRSKSTNVRGFEGPDV